jgi:(E)-4-hydroxy-3-methylbut-2-enyl-diphosphate synthase
VYCASPYVYKRRPSRVVNVGHVAVGGDHPIRVQSMLTCDTMDTEKCIAQTIELANVGCEIVRITAPTVKDAANLEHIVKGLRDRDCQVPIVADIHFKPEAAMEAAKWVEKVRINPGNYADSKKFKIIEYTDEQYAAELERIRERFTPLVNFCKEHGRAMRIGTNHGSLSDRIMNRYGDTPMGMVESALEFARIARDFGYHDFMFSMKSSNPKVMIEAYRLLVARLWELDEQESGVRSQGSAGPNSWLYPIHLGVTEAGDGEDGRIKSAIGIGSLLSDGIGDTIRVSLTEDSVHEIPVAQALVAPFNGHANAQQAGFDNRLSYDPFTYRRRATERVLAGDVPLGAEETVRVFTSREKWDALAHKLDRLGDYQPEVVVEDSGAVAVDPRDDAAVSALLSSAEAKIVTVADGVDLPVVTAFRLLAARIPERHPILLKDSFTQSKDSNVPFLSTLLWAASRIGSLLCDGIGDAVLIQGEQAPGQSLRLAYNILQAAGTRIFKTDYVACPSCGRTLFDLQSTTARIKSATSHLKGVKIAIMGCIVNGPGEMADADFGYVGGAPGKVNLYVGKQAVKFNIPEAEAVDCLKDLIREHGKWVEMPLNVAEPETAVL